MRSCEVTINGKKYLACYSANAQIAIQSRNLNPKSYENMLATASEMLKAGYRWAQITGQKAEEPPTEEEIGATLDIFELSDLMVQFNDVFLGERNVVAEPPKKKDTETSES